MHPGPPRIRKGLTQAAKRTLFCTTLTLIAATPSYLLVASVSDLSFDSDALLLAVAAFAAFWSVIACLPITSKLLSLPFVRPTVRIGYIARSLFTLLFPLSGRFESWIVHEIFGYVQTIMPSGFISNRRASHVQFLPTLTIALLDGAINSLLLLILMATLWSFLIVRKRPTKVRGFSVEPVQNNTQ